MEIMESEISQTRFICIFQWFDYEIYVQVYNIHRCLNKLWTFIFLLLTYIIKTPILSHKQILIHVLSIFAWNLFPFNSPGVNFNRYDVGIVWLIKSGRPITLHQISLTPPCPQCFISEFAPSGARSCCSLLFISKLKVD